MLVLSRKNKEEILIGDDICITVIEVGRDRVRLGLDAPKEICIQRAELHSGLSRVAKKEMHTGVAGVA